MTLRLARRPEAHPFSPWPSHLLALWVLERLFYFSPGTATLVVLLGPKETRQNGEPRRVKGVE